MSNVKVTMLKSQIHSAIDNLLQMVEGVPTEVLHAVPAGRANSIAANFAHCLDGTDKIINGMIQGKAPLLTTMPTGISESQPGGADLFNWYAWGTRVQVNLPEATTYAKAVQASVDTYLDSISDNDLDTLMETPGGQSPVFYFLNAAVLFNILQHTGEISAIKGLHDIKGYSL